MPRGSRDVDLHLVPCAWRLRSIGQWRKVRAQIAQLPGAFDPLRSGESEPGPVAGTDDRVDTPAWRSAPDLRPMDEPRGTPSAPRLTQINPAVAGW
jgi:hypothetical protein